MTPAGSPAVIELWPDGVPGSESRPHEERETLAGPPDKCPIVRNVSRPSLTAYLPDQSVATGTGVIVAPGGAFHVLAIEHEGTQVAEWLVQRGIAAFVLRYRLWPTNPNDDEFVWPAPHSRETIREVTRQIAPLAIADGQKAIRVVRERAKEWGLAPTRIGMLGFSAGGRVTAGIALEQEPASRLDFAAVVYGALWDEIAVPPDAPPLFILFAADDTLAAERCLRLYEAWHSSNHSVEMHSFAAGGHGFGMKRTGLPVDGWIDLFHRWLAFQLG